MTEPLVSADDDDWTAFKAAAPEYFLGAAGAEVRRYVGWHLAPSVTVTVSVEIGSQGIIMLPSRYVTAVSEVVIATGQDDGETTGLRLDPADYSWHTGGWIVRRGGGPYLGGFYYGPTPYYVPAMNHGRAQVTFTHGYTELPDDVKAVVFELAQSAADLPSGNVSSIAGPNGYQVDLSQDAGLSLNKDQKNRLANYRIGRVA